MTKEELEKEAEEKAETYSEAFIEKGVAKASYAKGYLASAEPREEQIQIDAEQIRALQKTNGALTDRVRELETSVSNLRKDNKELREVLPKLDKENDELKYKLTKAKDLLLKLSTCLEGHSNNNFEYELIKEAEQFLKETK